MIAYTYTVTETDFFHSDAASVAPVGSVTDDEVAAYRREQLAIAKGERPEVTKMYESIYRSVTEERAAPMACAV
jgi:hypothetical protein